jgi:hypothetical protein
VEFVSIDRIRFVSLLEKVYLRPCRLSTTYYVAWPYLTVCKLDIVRDRMLGLMQTDAVLMSFFLVSDGT